MTKRRQFIVGSLFFALMFFYLSVHAFFAFVHVGSSDGWHGQQKAPGEPVYILGTDPQGPATALQPGDQFLAINGITPAQDPEIMTFSDRAPPGTTYLMTVRRHGQELVVPLKTVEKPGRSGFGERVFILIHLIFLVTGLAVFLLKPDNRQAWLLALLLGTFVSLSTWTMPVIVLGSWVVFVVALAKILGLWSLPLFVRFFLNFPERSPVLRRWPKLEAYLNWPLYLLVLPSFGASRLPAGLRTWYFTLPPIKWLTGHSWFGLPMPVIAGYLVAGLVCLVVNYRVANRDARRRLRVVMAGSGAGFLTYLLAVGAEFLRLSRRAPGLVEWVGVGMMIALPFIPLSFAYAIIRHKVIPMSLIIRRSARYVLVSRGSAVLVIAGVGVVMFFVMDAIFSHVNPVSGRVVGIISGVLAIIVWNLAYSFHRRVIAPLIDRHFFREAYDAQQIIADLTQSLRTTTNVRQLLELVVTRIQKALHTENVTVFLRAGSGEYVSALSADQIKSGESRISSSSECKLPPDAFVVQRLSESSRPLEVDLRDPDSWLSQHWLSQTNGHNSRQLEQETLRRLRSTLLLPLATKDGMLGLISLGPRLGDLPFSSEDERLLMSVAGPTTFAVENANLVERMVEEERRRREIEVDHRRKTEELAFARQIQLSMLPRHHLSLDRIEVIGQMRTATEVGGDYYDFLQIDDDRYCLAIGDATGHGIAAGLVVGMVKMALINSVRSFAADASAEELVTNLNVSLKASLGQRGIGMCFSLTILDTRDLTAEICSTGMPYPLHFDQAANRVQPIPMPGPPLGFLKKIKARSHRVQLRPGDSLILMSDGLPERMNQRDEMWGYETVAEEAARTCGEETSAERIGERLIAACDGYAGERETDDDMTVMVARVKC